VTTLWLHLQAPFAAFRPMQAGVYRASLPTLPPSAAWGLVLNLAGIETRKASDVTTLIDSNAPRLKLCIGLVSEGQTSVLYQQLHSYPVGSSGKDLQAKTFGSKYWIAPVRREILVGFEAMVGVEASDDLLTRVHKGLRGELPEPRYGLPFAGDNNLLFDRIEPFESPPMPVYWYSRLDPGDSPRRGSCRFTVGIDRSDSSKTSSALVAPLAVPQIDPPEGAWFWVPRSP
jgi:CRISPR-associated protein Cas5t